MIANLMIFYKGGLSYTELQSMPLPNIFRLQEFAARINKERERANK